jgi:hypothetical protein
MRLDEARALLHKLEKAKFSFPCRDSNHDSPTVQLVAWSPYRLFYTSGHLSVIVLSQTSMNNSKHGITYVTITWRNVFSCCQVHSHCFLQTLHIPYAVQKSSRNNAFHSYPSVPTVTAFCCRLIALSTANYGTLYLRKNKFVCLHTAKVCGDGCIPSRLRDIGTALS